MTPMRVAMIAAEAVPFAKAGGLADVVGALPIELERLGVDVCVVMPRHRSVNLERFGFEPFSGSGEAPVGGVRFPFEIHCGRIPKSNVRVFLIGNDWFFDRAGIYVDPRTGFDYPDQSARWIFFQRAAVDFIRSTLPEVDIVH